MEMKEEYAERVNNRYDGDEDKKRKKNFGLKRKLLDVASEVCGYSKGKPRYFETVGGIKIRMWLCLERGNYFGFGHSWNEQDRKKYCEVKRLLRD